MALLPVFDDLTSEDEWTEARDRLAWVRGWLGAIPSGVAVGLLLWYIGYGPSNAIDIVLALATMGFTGSMAVWLRCAMVYHCRFSRASIRKQLKKIEAAQAQTLSEMQAYREEMKRVRLEYIGADTVPNARTSANTRNDARNTVVPFPNS